MPEPLVLVMAAFALLSFVLLVAALAAVRKRRWIGTSLALVLAVLCLALAALAATLGVAMQGYRALTREVVAATVVTRPTGPERFMATPPPTASCESVEAFARNAADLTPTLAGVGSNLSGLRRHQAAATWPRWRGTEAGAHGYHSPRLTQVAT